MEGFIIQTISTGIAVISAIPIFKDEIFFNQQLAQLNFRYGMSATGPMGVRAGCSLILNV